MKDHSYTVIPCNMLRTYQCDNLHEAEAFQAIAEQDGWRFLDRLEGNVREVCIYTILMVK